MIIAVITVGPAGKPLLFKGARVNAMEMTHQPYLCFKNSDNCNNSYYKL